jgi:spermidine synthase
MHSYQMDWETFALVGRTFTSVFPNSLLVLTDPSGRGFDYLLVGFKGKDRLALEYGKQKLVHVRKSKNVTLTDPRLLYRLIVSEDLQGLFGQGTIHTDNQPLLEFAAPKLLYHDDLQIFNKKIQSEKWQSLRPDTRNIIQQITANADSQIDFSAYALSVFAPFRDMVDLSKATSLQKERFFELMERYCASNKLDYSILKDNELKQRCLSIQIEFIQNKIDFLPDRLASLYYLGSLYNIKRWTSKAISYFTEVLRINPKYTKAHNELGIVLSKQGRLDEAISHFSEVLRINSGNAEAHYNLGLVLANQGRMTEAISHFSEVLQINPEDTEAHNELGIALSKQGRIDEAISHFSEVLRINSGYAEVHNNLGMALVRKGRIEDAVVHFRAALRIKPAFVSAHNNLKKVLTLQKEKMGSGIIK